MAEYTVLVNTQGTAGSASGSAKTPEPVRGHIEAIRIDYDPSAPVSTLVDVDELGGLSRKLLDLPAGNADKTYYPRIVGSKVDGSDGTEPTERYYIPGRYVQISVSASNQLTPCVTATILTDE